MNAKIWGIRAIIISIAIWAVFAWTWLVFVGPGSSIWDCQFDGYAWITVGPDGVSDCQYGFDLDVLGSLIAIIVVFFVPVSILSLISSISLIRMKKAKVWGIVAMISSFGVVLLYMIGIPGFDVFICKEAHIPNLITFYCFLLLSATSLISSIVLIRRSRKKTIDMKESSSSPLFYDEP